MSTTVWLEPLVDARGTDAQAGEASRTPSWAGRETDHARLEVLRPLLLRTASAVLRHEEDAEDAVQEALLRVLRHPERFDEQKGTLAAYARTTVRRVALDML